ncbi:hypothetical protein [Rufibacter psychrotolerans]|uniref:hypothetical protein n=1 Tax=Rufibacter psychrotolerans TaxID=2812556 RepID=UPI00196813A6|nr:hypothetical protein [Rufibacter sp. SYSU D00308]
MKKFTLSFRLLALLLSSVLVMSCGDDDEDDVAPLTNQIEYDNTRYGADIALSIDFGPFGFIEGTNTHYAQVFALLDTVTKTESTRAVLDMFLLSAGTSVFKTGTFTYADLSEETDEEAVAAKYRDQNIFILSAFLLDVNNDQELDEDTEAFQVKSGTVTVSGTAPNYTIECDLLMQNDKGLKAHYSGEVFPIPANPDEEEDDATAGMRKAPKWRSGRGNVLEFIKSR